VQFRIGFRSVAVKRIPVASLPADWQTSPVPVSTQRIGDAWVLSGETAILAVPSSIIPLEENYLLNPLHPDFAKITIHPAESFYFDPRLAQLLAPAP
jgi:RES domain-containing protein